MRIFVSGKVGRECDVKRVMQLLRQAGHEITFDWTNVPHLKPYDLNAKASRETAVLETRGVKDSDILIILANDRGVGMFVEMGIAIGVGIPVRVVTDQVNQTMFFHHPLVKCVTNVEDAIRELVEWGHGL